MSERSNVLRRMRDVLLALDAAHSHGESLNRIRLQKFIYLLDATSFVYSLFPPREGHFTYKHGPFDPSIQNAVDALAFRGFVKISRLSRESAKGTISCDYDLTSEGGSWIRRHAGDPQFENRRELAKIVARKVSTLGWHRLRELVYAEPTFLSTKSWGYGQRLRPDDVRRDSSAALLAAVARAVTYGFKEIRPEPEWIIGIFFDYLDRYVRQERLRLIPADEGGD